MTDLVVRLNRRKIFLARVEASGVLKSILALAIAFLVQFQRTLIRDPRVKLPSKRL